MPVSTSRPPITRSTWARWDAEADQEGRKRLHGERRDDERHTKPERIDGEQACALGHGGFRRRNCQDRGQDRPDARRPADRKGQAHHIGAPQSHRFLHLDPRLPVQEADRGKPEEVQPHDDDGDAGDDRELIRIKAQQRADHACARAECDEDGREPGHEQGRSEHRVPLHLRRRLLVRKTLERGAGQIDQIGRHQRQHAGRQEAHQAGQERGEDRDVGSHGG